MGRRTGGVRSTEQRNQNVYFCDGYAYQLLNYLRPHYWVNLRSNKHPHEDTPYRVLDACSGTGVLERAFQRNYDEFNVNYFHLHKRDLKLDSNEIEKGSDVLHNTNTYDLIICNPPWSLKVALPLYEHLISLLDFHGVMFFIINNVFRYQGWERAEKIQDQKFYFLPRWIFKPTNHPLLDCGVSVFHKHTMPTEAAMLPSYIKINQDIVEYPDFKKWTC